MPGSADRVFARARCGGYRLCGTAGLFPKDVRQRRRNRRESRHAIPLDDASGRALECPDSAISTSSPNAYSDSRRRITYGPTASSPSRTFPIPPMRTLLLIESLQLRSFGLTDRMRGRRTPCRDQKSARYEALRAAPRGGPAVCATVKLRRARALRARSRGLAFHVDGTTAW